MVFGETFENTDNLQAAIDWTLSSTRWELSELNKKVEAGASHQEIWAVEKLPQAEIDNIVKFYDTFGSHINKFSVRARADSIWWSDAWAKENKKLAYSMALSLKEDGIIANPDLSTGNTARAWLRAMTLLNQLPKTIRSSIANKISFDVLAVNETDTKWTYRFAALDVHMSGRDIPNIQKIPPQKNIDEIQPIIPEELDVDDEIEEETLISTPQEYKRFESWEALKKPLWTHMFLEGEKIVDRDWKKVQKNFIKRTYYSLKDWKIVVKNWPWKETSLSYDTYKDKKAYSVVMDVSDTLWLQYKDDIQKIFKENKSGRISKTLAFLNLFTQHDSVFALNQLYTNYSEKKEWKEYIMRAQEISMKERQNFLVSNN